MWALVSVLTLREASLLFWLSQWSGDNGSSLLCSSVVRGLQTGWVFGRGEDSSVETCCTWLVFIGEYLWSRQATGQQCSSTQKVKISRYVHLIFSISLTLSIHHVFKCLYEAGEKKWGTDEVQFMAILCTRNRCHLLRGRTLCGVLDFFSLFEEDTFVGALYLFINWLGTLPETAGILQPSHIQFFKTILFPPETKRNLRKNISTTCSSL